MANKLLRYLRKKIGDAAGETLVEVLVSTLIIAGVMLMLCTAIVAAARVNASIENKDTNFNAAALTSSDQIDIIVTIDHESGDDPSFKVSGYTQNGYVCYVPY